MRPILIAALAGAGLFVLAGCELDELAGSASVKEDFHYSHALKPGGRLAVETFNGSITISGWDREEVDISGTRQASSKELLDAMKIDIVPTAEAVRIRTVRPSGWRGNMGASFTIKAPRRLLVERAQSSNGSVHVEEIEGNVRLETSNGRIRAVRVRGDVEATTSNGSVELTECTGAANLKTSNGRIQADGVRGPFEATTSNAKIEARLLEVSGSLPTKLRTSNGAIQLTLEEPPKTDVVLTTSNGPITVRAPSSLAATVKASTSNGQISTSFRVAGEKSKTRLEGTVGAGGPLLELATSNGSINLEPI
jgi:hypothetical protein